MCELAPRDGRQLDPMSVYEGTELQIAEETAVSWYPCNSRVRECRHPDEDLWRDMPVPAIGQFVLGPAGAALRIVQEHAIRPRVMIEEKPKT